MGRASGSSAGLIYQAYYGNTYARSFPLIFHSPDTKKQQQCQASFFDIQRVWLPIYNKLSNNISKMQRKNKNPFNKLMASVYRIFNPYQHTKFNKLPKDFGLDRYNRLRAVVRQQSIKIDENTITLRFYMMRPIVEIGVSPIETHVLLFNLTQQNMYYHYIPLRGDENIVELYNGNKWEPSNNIALYIALSAPNWLGNFNLFPL